MRKTMIMEIMTANVPANATPIMAPVWCAKAF